MELVAVVVLLALLQYVGFAMLVGRARVRHKIDAPAVTGHPEFERYFRVQQNTVELLVLLLPAIFIFATYVSATWAAVLGAAYLVGRLLYLRSYVADPKTRSAGFGLSLLPILIMVLGGLWGAVSRLLG